MRRNVPPLCACMLALCLLAACGVGRADTAPQGAAPQAGPQDFVMGVPEVSLLDPAEGYNGWGTIRYGVAETLFALDQQMNVQHVLVNDYALSDDQHTWTLHLREDVLFHNGRAMDAQAVKACLERLVEKNSRAAADLMLAYITADRYSLSITTEVPNPTLINALCDPYACIIDVAEADSMDVNRYPVGTGPYVVKRYTDGEAVYLEPFAAYWNGTPASKSVTIQGVADLNTLSMAMQNGELDAAYGLPYDALPLFADNAAFQVSQVATTRVYMLYFNLQSSAMGDETLRRAICMAADKQAYATILLNGAGTPTKAAFPSALPYGDDGSMTAVPDYDPEGARALLAQGGYADTNGDGLLEKDGEKFSLRLLTYSRAGLPESAQALQAALADIGLAVEYELVDNVSGYLTAGDYDICVYAYVTTPTGDPFSFLNFTTGTGSGSNFGGYSSPEVDDRLRQLSVSFDTARRAQLATEIQQIITADSAYCYLFHLNMFMVSKAGVTGVQQSPVDYYMIGVDTARG